MSDDERNPTPSGKRPAFRFSILHALLAVWLLLFVRDFMNFKANVQPIAYSQFLSDVNNGKVSTAEIAPDRISGEYKDSTREKPSEYITTPVTDDPNLVPALTKANVKFTGARDNTWFKDVLSWVVPAVVLALIWAAIFKRMGQGQRGGFLSLGKNKAKIFVEKDLKTRFDDVAGVDEAKEELKEVVSFLRHPEQYSRLGGHMPKGVLLVGPPGTGKTLLARAVAGEANVTFFSINGSEFVELFVGLGAARVRDLFEQARAQAPCILFIDELDALGKARGIGALSGTGNDEKEQTLNQLLAELDGFDSSKGIVLIGATNRPEVLDQALLRAGRFDRQVLVDKPDRLGRMQILKIHLKKVTLPDEKTAAQVDAEVLASLTAGFSGADLANLVNEAALIATRRGALAVELRDFTEGIERVIAGLERKNRLLNPEEKRRVAYHEMGHTVVALACGEGEAVHKVSIIPRGIGALGYTFRRPTEDRYLLSRLELEHKMAIAMGGRAAEVVFCTDISTGAADDLDKATEIARAMITRYGMSERLGLAILEKDQAPILGTGFNSRAYDYSELTAQDVDAEIKRLLNRALTRALNLVERYKSFIEEGAQVLLTKETLDETEIKDLWKRNSAIAEQKSAISGPTGQVVKFRGE